LPKVAAEIFPRAAPDLFLVLAKASVPLPPLEAALRLSRAPTTPLAVEAMPSVALALAGPPGPVAMAFATVVLAVPAKPAAVRVLLSKTLARWLALALEIWPRIALPFG
jgi:hypothetical protein